MADHDNDLSPVEVLGPQASLTVKSALKSTLDHELATEACTPGDKIGGAATPQHTASRGRSTAADTRAGRSPR